MQNSDSDRSFVLEPGDVIATGTPPGVAFGMKPPQYLKEGDVVTLGIEGLEEQKQKVVKGSIRPREIISLAATVLHRKPRGEKFASGLVYNH